MVNFLIGKKLYLLFLTVFFFSTKKITKKLCYMNDKNNYIYLGKFVKKIFYKYDVILVNLLMICTKQVYLLKKKKSFDNFESNFIDYFMF